MSTTNRTNGRRYLRALQHALSATAKDRPELAQIGFIHNFIVGARPRLMHVGVLPSDYAVPHAVIVTRTSAVEIWKTLKGYDARTNGKFDISQSGLSIEIHVGEEHVVEDGYTSFECGYVPSVWRDRWVREMPAEQGTVPAIDSAIIKRALSAWKDNGRSRVVHGPVATDPVIVEVTSKEGETLAYAWALPDGRPDALLADDSPLFDKTMKDPRGRSVLEFTIAIVPAGGPPKVHSAPDGSGDKIFIGGGKYEVDVTGLPPAFIATLPLKKDGQDDVGATIAAVGDYRRKMAEADAAADDEAAPAPAAKAEKRGRGRPKKQPN